MSDPTRPRPARAADETQSLLNVSDYVDLLEHYRVWLIGGLLLAMAVTFCAVKFTSLKFYKAEARFFINNRLPVSKAVGLIDVAQMDSQENIQYLASVNGQLAEEFLQSEEVLTSTTLALAAPPDNYDLYKALRFTETDPEKRKSMLLTLLRKSLLDVKALDFGIVSYKVELPDPVAAARFANISLELVQRKFMQLQYGYFAKAGELYAKDLDKETSQQVQLAATLRDFNRDHYYDINDAIKQQREMLEEQLKALTGEIAEKALRVNNLKLATSPEALRAAQPLQIINPAEVPLKKSRPQTMLTTAVAGVLYLFVFLTGLMLISMWRALRGTPRA